MKKPALRKKWSQNTGVLISTRTLTQGGATVQDTVSFTCKNWFHRPKRHQF